MSRYGVCIVCCAELYSKNKFEKLVASRWFYYKNSANLNLGLHAPYSERVNADLRCPHTSSAGESLKCAKTASWHLITCHSSMYTRIRCYLYYGVRERP